MIPAHMQRAHAPKWPVMQALLAQGAAKPTHSRLAELAYVNKRTISNVVKEAGAGAYLVSGRPARLGPGLGLVLAISLGTETLRAGLVDCNGDLHCAREGPRDPEQLAVAPRVLLSRIAGAAVAVLEEAISKPDLCVEGALPLLGFSMAWPSPVDRAKRVRGRVMRDGLWRRNSRKTGQAPTLPERFSKLLGPPFSVANCHAINDVSAAALGVNFRKSREQALAPDEDQWRVGLVVRVGGGLGSGTILMAPHRPHRLSFIDSLLVEGTNGLAGELGHLPIGRRVIEDLNEECEIDDLAPMRYDDWRCSCGRKHHLEAFASGSAVLRRLEDSGYGIATDDIAPSSVIREAVESGPDEVLVHALQDVGRLVGRALTGPILMLDPHSITFTGSLASEHVVEGMRRERDVWANAIEDRVQIDYLDGPSGAYVGVLGAGMAVIRRKVYREVLDSRAGMPELIRFNLDDLKRLRKRLAAPPAT